MNAPRDALLQFAVDMETQLRANDYKGGWKDIETHWLLYQVELELKELRAVLLAGSKEDVIHEAADAANFLMMLADNHRNKDGS